MMRHYALRRYANPAERERMSLAVKKAFKGVDRSGPNNAHYGKPHSEEAKARIGRLARERGL